MDRKWIFALWGGLFAVCAGLGFVAEPQGALAFLMGLLGLVFFAPPVVLLHRAKMARNIRTAALVRNLSAASLALTVLTLVANVLSIRGSAALGDVLHVVLVIVSTPMFCEQVWVLSLFCWAFLMIAAHKLLKQMKKTQT